MNGRLVWLRLKAFAVLIVIMIIDIGPVPVVGLIFLYVLLFRPAWFKAFIDQLYS